MERTRWLRLSVIQVGIVLLAVILNVPALNFLVTLVAVFMCVASLVLAALDTGFAGLRNVSVPTSYIVVKWLAIVVILIFGDMKGTAVVLSIALVMFFSVRERCN